MRELLLINNEPTPEDRGRIARAGELGLTDPLYNIDALSAKLSEFGTVTVRHYTQLRTLDSAPDAIFLSGCFTDWDRERLRETFADELALIRETMAPPHSSASARAYSSSASPSVRRSSIRARGTRSSAFCRRPSSRSICCSPA